MKSKKQIEKMKVDSRKELIEMYKRVTAIPVENIGPELFLIEIQIIQG